MDKLAPSHTVRASHDSTHNVDWRVRLIRAEGLDQMVKMPQAAKLLAKNESKYKGLAKFITDTLVNNMRVMTYGPPIQQAIGAASSSTAAAGVEGSRSSNRSKPKPKSQSLPQLDQSSKRKDRLMKTRVANDSSSDSDSDSSSEGDQWGIYQILKKRRSSGGRVQYLGQGNMAA